MYDDENNHKDYQIWQFYAQSIQPIDNKNVSLMNDIHDEYSLDTQNIPPNILSKKTASLNAMQAPLQRDISSPIKIHHHTFEAETNAKRRMKKGRFIFNAKIDLHGQSQNQAFDNLEKFIINHYKKQVRHLLIITGRGRYCYQNFESSGVLIKKVPEWLKNPPFSSMISVIEQASSYDGGQGALYVILRKE